MPLIEGLQSKDELLITESDERRLKVFIGKKNEELTLTPPLGVKDFRFGVSKTDKIYLDFYQKSKFDKQIFEREWVHEMELDETPVLVRQ